MIQRMGDCQIAFAGKPAPTPIHVVHRPEYDAKNCGSGLAREEAGTITSNPKYPTISEALFSEMCCTETDNSVGIFTFNSFVAHPPDNT